MSSITHHFDEALRARARRHLDGFERRRAEAEGLRPAAVAVVLLPDAEGRRRLLELYGEGLELTLSGDEPLIAALDGSARRSSASCCGAPRC